MTLPADPYRRLLLGRGAAAFALSSLIAPWKGSAFAQGKAFQDDPFKLGVASGDPSPDGFVLWTRLAPQPLEPDGGMGTEPVVVVVEVAADEGFSRIVATQRGMARPDRAFAIHAEFGGLQPDRLYWYRFRANGVVSPIGRTKTAPLLGAPVASLRFGWVSCAHYEQGYFTPYRDLAAQNPDLVLSTGDYIYEGSWGPQVRRHAVAEAVSLEDYRLIHAQYKTDPDLQRLHATCPWLFIWDDHEVANDYQGDVGKMPRGMDRAGFPARRVAAYRAFYEHTPLRLRSRLDALNQMRIWGVCSFGNLVNFTLLDARQIRSPLACSPPGRVESTMAPFETCKELADPARTMLGEEQERFVQSQYMAAPFTWSVLVQQSLFSNLVQYDRAGKLAAFTDGWGGYAPARQRLLDVMAARSRNSNAVVVGGDMHSFWASDVKADYGKADSAVVGTEFVTTSITAHSYAYDRFTQMLPENPHIRFFDDRIRGYGLADVAPTAMKVQFRATDSVWKPDAPFRTLKSYVVTPGKPGVQEA